jgi:hypothetical protein
MMIKNDIGGRTVDEWLDSLRSRSERARIRLLALASRKISIVRRI